MEDTQQDVTSHLGQRTRGVGHTLVDEEGQAPEQRDGSQRVDVECVAPPDLVRDGGPAQPPAQVAHGQGHEVGGGEGGGDQRRHRVGEHRLDHGLGHGHDAHAAGAEQGRGGEQQPELRRLEQVVHMDAGARPRPGLGGGRGVASRQVAGGGPLDDQRGGKHGGRVDAAHGGQGRRHARVAGPH